MKKLLFILSLTLTIFSCTDNLVGVDFELEEGKNVYVLVHGNWHGAWCWRHVEELLEAQGHGVVSVELPGSGFDTTPLHEVSMEGYINRVVEVINNINTESVILVGHSGGGMVITGVAEAIPNKISSLYYISGWLPQSGQPLGALAQQDEASLVPPHIIFSEDGLSSTIREGMEAELFYHDCPQADIDLALSRLTPQAMPIFGQPVFYTEGNFGSVPKYYIRCANDRAISIGMQNRMIEAVPCDGVFTLQTSHSPFFADPVGLTDILTAAE